MCHTGSAENSKQKTPFNFASGINGTEIKEENRIAVKPLKFSRNVAPLCNYCNLDEGEM